MTPKFKASSFHKQIIALLHQVGWNLVVDETAIEEILFTCPDKSKFVGMDANYPDKIFTNVCE